MVYRFRTRHRRRGGRPHFVMDGVVLALVVAVIVAAVVTMSGCATPVRESVFETGGPTTEQVWHGTGARTALLGDTVGRNPGGPAGAAAWTRSAGNELSALFPELHNPRIILYVFPHLSADGAPVPGYVTNFPLYRDARIFALPGEAFREGTFR